MPVPKQRLASRRGRTRAAHHGLKKVSTVECSECHQPILPHRACQFCGAYRGRNVRSIRPVKPVKEATKSAEPVPVEEAKA